MKMSKAERKRQKLQEKRDKEDARREIRKALRDKLRTHVSTCEVMGCRREWTDMHHMVNPGKSLKDDRYENVMGLCHEHHMQIDNTPNWSKVRWAEKYFWGSTYREVADYVAMVRRLEEAGRPPEGIWDVSLIDVPNDGGAFAVIKAYAERMEKPYDFGLLQGDDK